MNKHNFCSWPNIILCLLFASVLMSCNKNTPETTKFTGYVEAQLIYIAAPQSGWLTIMNWQAGDKIKSSDIAFQLDDTFQLAVVNQAKAKLEQAKALELDGITGAREQELAVLEAQRKQAQVSVDFAASEKDRWNELVKQGLAPASKATQVNLDYEASIAKLQTTIANIQVAKLGVRNQITQSAKANQQAAVANLEQAQWQLSQRKVLSHVEGVIEEVFYRKGEFITTGNPVVAVLPNDALIVRFFVPQAQLSTIRLGDEVFVHSDSDETKAKIIHISRTAEFTPPVIYDEKSRKKLMFLVEARLLDQTESSLKLRPGLPVEVSR